MFSQVTIQPATEDVTGFLCGWCFFVAHAAAPPVPSAVQLLDASCTPEEPRDSVLAKDHHAVRTSLLRLAHHDADRRAEVGARHIRELRAKESTTEQQLCDAAIAEAQDEANAADARVQQLVHTARAEPHSAIESNSQPFV